MKWVKEVDGNSEFFHRVVNGRHNRKYIEVLENKEGTLLDNIDSISKETLHFFEKLYKNPPRESWRLEGFRLGTHFSRESATWLEHPSTEEEILKAIFQLDKDKAPGPDGFTLLFRSVHSLSVLRIFHPSCFCLLSSSSSLFIFLIH